MNLSFHSDYDCPLPTSGQVLGDEHARALGIGLAGAHRTGKTTLARKLAKANDIPLVASSASAVAQQMGITVDAGMPFRTRLEFQEKVLEAFERDYARHEGQLFVSDRTPLDMAAYLMLDWHPHVSDEFHDAWAQDYMRRCMDVTNRYFFLVSVLQPGIGYAIEEGKPAPNDLYQELMNVAVIGFVRGTERKFRNAIFPREMTNLKERAKTLSNSVSEELTEYRGELASVFTMQ